VFIRNIIIYDYGNYKVRVLFIANYMCSSVGSDDSRSSAFLAPVHFLLAFSIIKSSQNIQTAARVQIRGPRSLFTIKQRNNAYDVTHFILTCTCTCVVMDLSRQAFNVHIQHSSRICQADS